MPSLHKKKRKIPKAHHLTPPLTPEDAEMSDAKFAQTIDFYQLRDCFKEPVIVYTASAVVETIAKGALQRNRHDVFAAFVVESPSSFGKSPIAKAILSGSTTVPMDSTNRNFRNSIEGSECGYVVCDDIFPTPSQTILTRFSANIQDATRFCYDGSWPVTVITAEPGITENVLFGSARSRAFVFHLDKQLTRDSVLSHRVRFFQSESDWPRLISKFGHACESSDKYFSEDYFDGIDAFRNRHSNSAVDAKAIDMIFAVLYGWRGFNRYVQSICGAPLLTDQMLAELEKLLFSCSARSVTEAPLVEVILERVLKGDYFTPQHPHTKNLCERYVRFGTTTCDIHQYPSDECDSCYHCKFVENVYDPIDLIFHHNGTTNAVLLDRQNAVYFCRQRRTPVSVLIVEKNLLSDAMEQELIKWLAETKQKHRFFTPQKLRAELYALNRCMALDDGQDGLRYVFDYPCEENQHYETHSVLALLLKESEAKYLATRSPVSTSATDYVYRTLFTGYISNINSTLQSNFVPAQYCPTGIGEDVPITYYSTPSKKKALTMTFVERPADTQ